MSSDYECEYDPYNSYYEQNYQYIYDMIYKQIQNSQVQKTFKKPNLDCLKAVTDVLKDFLAEGTCTKEILKKIRGMNKKCTDKLFDVLYNQSSILKTYPNYSLYKIDITNGKCEHYLDLTNESVSEDNFETSIQSDLNNLLLHVVSPESLVMYITDNSNKDRRYIFISLWLGAYTNKSSHQTGIVIDTYKNNIYLYDPNGRSHYFDDVLANQYKNIIEAERKALLAKENKDIEKKQEENKETEETKEKEFEDNINKTLLDSMYIDGSEMIDTLLQTYFNKVGEILGVKYNYIKSSVWNPKRKAINRDFQKSDIGTGHCVMTTYMMFHYLFLTNKDLEEANDILTSLSDDELLYIINGYTLGITNTLFSL